MTQRAEQPEVVKNGVSETALDSWEEFLLSELNRNPMDNWYR